MTTDHTWATCNIHFTGAEDKQEPNCVHAHEIRRAPSQNGDHDCKNFYITCLQYASYIDLAGSWIVCYGHLANASAVRIPKLPVKKPGYLSLTTEAPVLCSSRCPGGHDLTSADLHMPDSIPFAGGSRFQGRIRTPVHPHNVLPSSPSSQPVPLKGSKQVHCPVPASFWDVVRDVWRGGRTRGSCHDITLAYRINLICFLRPQIRRA